MPKKFFVLIMAFLLVLAIMIMADTGERLKVEAVAEWGSVQAPVSRGPCTLAYTNGSFISYFSGFALGMQNVTYFNPATCPDLPPYPFEITDFSFTLYDYGAQWPVVVDVVVYDMTVQGDSCAGPGAELCRISVTCDQATFMLPAVGMVTFPTPCCVNGPFYIGLEYTDPGNGPFPSIAYDDLVADTCTNYFYYSGAWNEWNDIWTPPAPGYPMFWVNGETRSPNCGSTPECFWEPGDPHKMHFPQLPDEAGWDVNATQPMVLADDFMCMQTGPITDIHWWGSWRDGIEGEIQYFVLSFHEDIPAEQNPDGYSKPGITLWEMEVSPGGGTPFDPPTMEGWYDPATGEELWDNHQAYFQYDVCFEPDDPNNFYQDSGTIYWLNISAVVANPQETQWGWKSTKDHWNDDAVWAFWGELNWIDIWEPAQPLANAWGITIDPMGTFLGGFGEDAYGDGWYFYPQEDWWNIWFYDHPFDSTRYKEGMIYFDIFPMDPGQPMWVEVAVNWATDLWSTEFPDMGPPLPGVDEHLYIGRQILWQSDYWEGPVGPLPYEILDYNPEWVSVDVRGWNFDIPGGIIEHICRGSLDLAFVITGEPIVADSGACCVDPTGGPPSSCIYTTQTECEQVLGGFYQGNGVLCAGVEACCMPNGDCVMADALCCVNELGGTPQGAGSTCSAVEACCFPFGSCQDLDPLCCVDQGGTPQGPGSTCLGVQACCLPDGTCQTMDAQCCISIGGTPQGAGTSCSANTIACCLPGGGCADVDPLCCDDMGGTPSPIGALACLGDNNGNTIDDACEEREDLKWRQLPDLAPTGIDVAATCPGLFGECIVLADDFECTQTGPITEIHIYGSWFEEMYPMGDPGMVSFRLSIHRDVPAGIDQPWSHPGELIWMREFHPYQFMFEPYAMDIVEGYYDPIQEFYQEVADFICWKYIFVIDDSMFIQQGTTTDPVIYWLDVQAMPEEVAYFGWKTSLDHWNDDAVWSPGFEPVDPLWWMELRYPPPNPYAGESIDLAFEIYGEEQICDCIPGDANGDGAVNVGDAVYLIAYVFQSCPSPPCPPPVPYQLCSGDANCDCQVNVGDAVYIISYVFKGGPPPCDCLTWLSLCGPPLRK